MKKVFMFPGQGSQFVGMGKDFERSYNEVFGPLFEEAESVLDLNIKEICFSGPEELLKQTEITQPALLIHSVGVTRLLEREGIRPDYVAGHSVGQFAALVAAEVLTFEAALEIVRKRGLGMASVEEEGSMMTTVFSRAELRNELISIAENYSVDMAGDNSPTQIVFSGATKNIEAMLAEVNEIVGVKTQVLQVSQAFHSRLMQSMEAEFQLFCNQYHFNEAKLPIVLNCSAKETTDPELIFDDIIRQCTETVRWRETMETFLQKDVDAFIEVGPKKVLRGLMRPFGYKGLTMSTESVMSFKKNLKKLSKVTSS